MESTGLRRSFIYASMERGDFPKSFPLGARAVAWDEAEVEAWKLAKLQAAGRHAA
jgi:prophage regulatory protein